MGDEYVSIKKLADRLGMDRSHARRWILKHGVKPERRRFADSLNQLSLAVSADEADRLIELRRAEGFSENGVPSIAYESGVFYIVQLIPEHSSGRIKLGFAANSDERLKQHQTAAPTARIIKTWPCKRSWELTVIDCLTSEGCDLVLNEVYDCGDLAALLARGDELFRVLPKPGIRASLSDHSPLSPEQRRERGG